MTDEQRNKILRAEGFVNDAPPAPRPTCGTCPLWEPPALSNLTTGHEDSGECRLMPSVNHRFRWHWCGQHPDMPAWIRDEWPKVRAGR